MSDDDEGLAWYQEWRAECGARQSREVRTASRRPVAQRPVDSLVRTWRNMMARCYRGSHPQFADYGGRGIEVCDRWHECDLFAADMAPRPDGLSLDRIDNDGPYAPENCRWATQREQQNNRRSNTWIEANGERLTLAEWSRRSGLPHYLISKRIRAGWPPERAVSEPSLRSSA